MSLSVEALTPRLVDAGRQPTKHNLQCEAFAFTLEQMGAADLLDTICYEGSVEKKLADEHDRMMRDTAK